MTDELFNWALVWPHIAKIGIAYLLTLPVGWNRERESHGAGIRTFPIVSMASCGYLLVLQGNTPADVAAQSRILQGLIAGIGFIGGGAIVKHDDLVIGTATAASIWNAGIVGAAVAMGRYEIAVFLALANLLTLRFLKPLKIRLDRE